MTDEERLAAEKAAEEKAAAGKETPSLEQLIKENAELKRENAERRTTSKTVQEQLDKVKADQEAAAKEAAEKNGEFQTLYETASNENKTLKEKSESLSKVINGYLEREIEKVPEDKRSAIPDLEPTKKLEWLQEHGHTLLGSTVVKGPTIKEGGEEAKNSISRQDFDALSPVERQKHLSAGGKIHD